MSTLVTWLFAPDWLTEQQAAELSGYDLKMIRWLINDGALVWEEESGEVLIEKNSLREYQEAWLDIRAVLGNR